MRFFTLLFSLLITTSIAAQVVIVNSPPSVAGGKNFSAASFGGDLTAGIWTADAVFVNDGSANPTLGCNAATNAAALAGKIALIDRGTCSFSQKCSNAEMAGAIAVVVFNHTAGAGTITMSATAGFTVTIPCVMLSFEDGQAIRAALQSGPVNISIGAVTIFNDIGFDRTLMLRAQNGVVPLVQVQDSGYHVFPGLGVENYGLNAATNVTINAKVDFTPTGGTASQVYDQSDSFEMLEPDSIDGLILEPFDASTRGTGVYNINYSVSSDSTDQLGNNNTGSTNFYVSNNIFCKTNWDFANQRPNRTTAFTISGGGPIEFLSAYHIPRGEGYRIDSLQFYVAQNAPDTLGDILVTGYIYLWNDLNEDGSSNNDELEIVAITDFIFPNPSAGAAWVKVPVLDFATFDEGYEIPVDGLNFIIGVRYEGPEVVFIGFDQNYDQTQYINNFYTSDLDLSYFAVNAWINNVPDVNNGFLFSGTRGATSTAVYVNPIATPSNEVKKEVAEVSVFPNPVNSKFTAEVKLPEMSPFLEYSIRDASGRLIFKSRKDNVITDKADFDVSSLPSGQYYFVVKTENGSKSEAFTVQR